MHTRGDSRTKVWEAMRSGVAGVNSVLGAAGATRGKLSRPRIFPPGKREWSVTVRCRRGAYSRLSHNESSGDAYNPIMYKVQLAPDGRLTPKAPSRNA